MKKLSVFIEINGHEKYVGEIVGNGVEDSSFTYAEDYLSILSVLGRECLGAIKIIDEESPMIQPEYRKLSADEVKKTGTGRCN